MHARAAIAAGSLSLVASISGIPVAYGAPSVDGPQEDHARTPIPARPSRDEEAVYANAEVGYTSIDLQALTAQGLYPVMTMASAQGAFYGFGGGVRFGFLTLGARVRKADFHEWSVDTIDGELGARVTIDRVEPYFTFGAGYAKLASSYRGLLDMRDLRIYGFNGRAGVGVDYYADKNVTVGVNFTGDLVAMAPTGIDVTASPRGQAIARARSCDSVAGLAEKQQCLTNVLQEAQGTSFGFAGAVSLVMGLHF